MVFIPGDSKVDLSIIASLKCNLSCWFCMYSAGPNNGKILCHDSLSVFLGSVNWDDINSIGFYGGEISVDTSLWQTYIDTVDHHINYQTNEAGNAVKRTRKWKGHKWCITNGSWSEHHVKFYSFIHWASNLDLQVFISTTEAHKKHQDTEKLQLLVSSSDRFRFKKDDLKSKLLPMGRNKKPLWTCSKRCLRLERHRLAILPNGDVIYQKCDGVYPVIANIMSKQITWTRLMWMLNNQFRCKYLDEDMGAISWEMKVERESHNQLET